MQYILGNAIEETKKIAERLGINGFPIPFISDFRDSNGELPIMISSHGGYHGDTLKLSRKLTSLVNAPDTKVIFDRHPDFLGSSKDDYASHAFTTCEEELVDEVHIYGIAPYIIDQIQHGLKILTIKESKTKLLYSSNIEDARRLVNKNLHLSVDVDVIRNASFVIPQWSGETGPTLENLLTELNMLRQNNNIAALDIVGYDSTDLGSSQNYTEGLGVYKKIIDVVTGVK